MRKRIIFASAGLALCGCAVDPSVYRQANLDCQAVGISQNDPQFATCSEVYARRHLEGQLDKAYEGALKRLPTDVDRRTPHQDVY